METLIKKHKIIIENATSDIGTEYVFEIWDTNIDTAADEAAELTRKYGEIKRIEGVLLGIKICRDISEQQHGALFHEDIYENEVIYREELQKLKDEK